MCRMTGYSSVMPLAAEDRAALAGDRERLARVVELADADLLGADRVLVLEPAEVQREQVALVELERHVGELLLGELEAGDRAVELLAVDGVRDGGLEAVARRADRAERRCRTAPRSGTTAGPAGPSTSGSTASAGSRTSSRTSSPVTEARSDSFWWISRAVNPGVPVGTTKPRMPSSVCAHTTATSATVPLVIHILVPLRTQSSPSRLAAVRMPPGWSRSRARSGRSSRSPRRPPCGGATPASAPPSRTRGSRTSPATPAR